jgi:hypothetical protein
VTGLRSIGCFVGETDVSAFLKIFDKNQDGTLKYSEFCDAFLPLDTNWASQLAAKPPSEVVASP